MRHRVIVKYQFLNFINAKIFAVSIFTVEDLPFKKIFSYFVFFFYIIYICTRCCCCFFLFYKENNVQLKDFCKVSIDSSLAHIPHDFTR